MSQIVSSAHIRHRLNTQFAGRGGTARLARVLGVTHTTAAAMRDGREGYSLTKAAAYFGFVPGDYPDEWRTSAVRLNPKMVGYVRWTPDRVDDLRRRAQQTKSVSRLAQDLGVSRDSVRSAVRRHSINVGAAA